MAVTTPEIKMATKMAGGYYIYNVDPITYNRTILKLIIFSNNGNQGNQNQNGG
jgi:hypothetical protein